MLIDYHKFDPELRRKIALFYCEAVCQGQESMKPETPPEPMLPQNAISMAKFLKERQKP